MDIQLKGFGEILPNNNQNLSPLAVKLDEWNGISEFFLGKAMECIGVVGSLLGHITSTYTNRLATPSTTILHSNTTNIKGVSLGEYSTNTSLLLTQSGEETHQWRLSLIRAAKQSIEISGNFCGGKRFDETLEALETAMINNPELKVHLTCSDDFTQESKPLLEHLQNNYSSQFNYLETSRWMVLNPEFTTIENHVKGTLIDEKYFIIGGTGITDKLISVGDKPTPPDNLFLGSASRDTDVVGSDPDLVKTMRMEFFKLYGLWEYRSSKEKNKNLISRHFSLNKKSKAILEQFDTHPQRIPSVQAKLSICSPFEHKYNYCTEEIKQVINSAKDSIQIAHMNINMAEPLKQVLMKKTKERQVNIDVVTNGLNWDIPTNVWFAGAHVPYYLPISTGREFRWDEWDIAKSVLDENPHINIYEYSVPGTLYHKKMIQVDDKTIIGSYNLGRKSDAIDYEWILTVKSKEISQQVKEQLHEDKKLSNRVRKLDMLHYYFSYLYNIYSLLEQKILCRFAC